MYVILAIRVLLNDYELNCGANLREEITLKDKRYDVYMEKRVTGCFVTESQNVSQTEVVNETAKISGRSILHYSSIITCELQSTGKPGVKNAHSEKYLWSVFMVMATGKA